MAGLAQEEFKTPFLTELVRACQQNSLPTLIGGDLNIMRNIKEKNNDRIKETFSCNQGEFLMIFWIYIYIIGG